MEWYHVGVGTLNDAVEMVGELELDYRQGSPDPRPSTSTKTPTGRPRATLEQDLHGTMLVNNPLVRIHRSYGR